MDELVLPPAPLWYRSSVVTCAPDNTLVYGAKNDIVLVKEKSAEEAAEVKVIHGAHTKNIISVGLNRRWKEPHSYAVSLGEDNVVNVWNLDTLQKKISNKKHLEHKEAAIGAVFAGDDRVVSTSVHGFTIVWNINTNESRLLKDLFKNKVTVTCLSSCPHAGWLLAFGLINGVVMVADLRRDGQILYKLRGHYQAVVSLSWCPAPINVFPRCNRNKVKNKSLEKIANESNQVKNISIEKIDNESDKVSSDSDKTLETKEKVNPWVNLVHADDGEVPKEKESQLEIADFLKECDTLKNKILGFVSEEEKKDKKEDDIVNIQEESKYNDREIDRSISQEFESGRLLPTLYDPSGDFLDDSVLGEEIIEDKDEANDINTEKIEKEEDFTVKSEEFEKTENSTLESEKPVKSDEIEGNLETLEQFKTVKSANEQNAEKIEKEDFTLKSEEVETTENSTLESEEVKKTGSSTLESEELVKSEEMQGNLETSAQFKSIKSANEQNAEIIEKEDFTLKSKEVEKTGNATLESEELVKSDEVEGNLETSEKSKSVEKEEKLPEWRIKDETNDSGIQNDEPPKSEEEEPRPEYLLASAGKDRTINIWRAGTDGRMQTFFHAHKRVNRKDKNTNAWISLCWVAPNLILTSCGNGELLAWPVPKPKESSKQFRVIHREHPQLIFNTVSPPKYSTPFNWSEKHDITVWTFGQDGRLVYYDLTAKKVQMSYSCVTAHVTCFNNSPLDPNRLAIGMRDGVINIWDLSLPHIRTVTMQKIQQKFTHKVSAIAWHPLKEMILGFGTEEGRVGFINIASKKPTLFPHYFRNQIYKVEWGPINADTNNLGLYVVAEGKIAIYDPDKSDKDPVYLELPGNLYVYKFAWKPDFSLLLLNGRDGCLVALTTDLVAITTLYPSEKGLNGLVWHPDSFLNAADTSPRCNWFAATTPRGILVYDCGSIRESDNFADKIVANFEGHVKPTLGLAWCPFEGNKIVSIAADGLAHVWDVTTKSAVATFVDPYISVNPGVVWSPVDPDLIITGDWLIRVWRISKNPPKTDEEFLAERKRLVTKIPKNDEKSNKLRIKVDLPSKSKNYIVPAFYVSNDENIELQVGSMRKLMNNVENQVGIKDNTTILDPLKLFGSKEQVSQLLDENYTRQEKEGKYNSCELISLWKGNIGDYIQNAINENRVNPTIINLAPMVSPKLWQDACFSYAKKLSEDTQSDPFETAMYFLTCHKVEDAINSLCTNIMFREALALAKQRLPENSEIINEVTEKWATHCISTGNFENAAICYISLKQYENAAKILTRRNHKEFLEFAAELAKKVDNKGLCDSIKYKLSELKNTPEKGSGDKTETPSRVDAILKKMNESQEIALESDSESHNSEASETLVSELNDEF